MGYTLESFGIYPSVIEDMVSLAEKLAIEVTGNESAIDDLHDWAIDFLQNNIDVEDITNSIIKAYFEEVQYLVGEMMEKIGIEMTVYWEDNCGASYIQLKDPNASGAVNYSEQELVNLLYDILVNEFDRIFSDMDIDSEVAENFIDAVVRSALNSIAEVSQTNVPELLKHICFGISGVMEETLNTRVDCEFNGNYIRINRSPDDGLFLPKFIIHNKDGDVDRVIEGAGTFIGTFKSNAFREVLESVKKED